MSQSHSKKPNVIPGGPTPETPSPKTPSLDVGNVFQFFNEVTVKPGSSTTTKKPSLNKPAGTPTTDNDKAVDTLLSMLDDDRDKVKPPTLGSGPGSTNRK